jgi:gliding motility-associated-like protein
VRNFYLCFIDAAAYKRLIIFMLLSGAVTILCHADNGALTGSFSSRISLHSGGRYKGETGRKTHALLSMWQKKPEAVDDSGTTPEETRITLNVLANDHAGKHDDDEDNSSIDPASVDLNPPTPVIDHSVSTEAGNYSVNDTGDLAFEPALNYTGTSVIHYTVNDDKGKTSNEALVSITVINVNDAPVITGQNPDPLSTPEDQPITITFNHLIVTDADNTYPTGFTLNLVSGAHYTVSGNTVTPDPNYFGALTVPVTVNDGELNSNVFDLKIDVVSVNDPPVITGQVPSPVTTPEDQAVTLTLSNIAASDADDTYPTGFTLQVSSGANYTVSGSTITPALNFFGTLSVPVTVNDGKDNSNSFNVQIDVTPVNDAPIITGQSPNPITTDEDQPITLQTTNLVVTDPDNTYPTGFTVTLAPGTNYSVSGSTITPASGYSGPLSVPVTVNDGSANSNTFALAVTVINVNDPPVITGQASLVVDEDNPIIITLSSLLVADNDNNYPADFTLALSAGPNYAVSGNTITPVSNYSGPLTVPVTVNDGTSNSAPFNLQITVNPVNDAPQVTGQTSLSTAENTPIQLQLSHLFVTDPDNVYPSGFALSVSPGANYTILGTQVTPAPGFDGLLSVGVSVNDGLANSNVFDLQIMVTAVNDPPVISAQQPLSMLEDNSMTLKLSDFSVTDPDNTFPNDFSLVILPGSGYTFSGTTITPSSNFAGTLIVNVKVNDGTSDSAPFAAQVNVTAVNDAPVITGQLALGVNEDQPLTLALANLTVADPDNNYPADFSFLVFAGTNYTLTGNTIIPTTNFHGTLQVPVQVNDGLLNSNIFPLQITVVPVNDPPLITGQIALSTLEDTPVAIQLSHLIVMDPDNTYPAGFTFHISPGSNYTVSGNTITPAQDYNGTLNIAVTVNDGTNESEPFNFQIQVGDTNDPPVITGQSTLTTNEEEAFTLQLSHLTVTDPDNPYPAGFTLLVSPGTNYAVSGTTITPLQNFAGILTVPVRVNDGVNNSTTFNLQLQVNQVNDAPSFDAIANQHVLENGVPAAVTITNISKGPGEDDQQLTFVATSGNTNVIPQPVIVYDPATSSAKLTYTLVPNASGVVTITIVAVDNGSSVAPNKNTYSSSFQIDVVEVNNAPTLDVINNVTVQEDAPMQAITLTGITAGAGENQTLTIEVTTDRPELFEIMQVTYTSAQTTGTLQMKPAANLNGVAKITVKVTDNGSAVPPSANSFSRSFTFTVQAVNDPPVFSSKPVTLAAVDEAYEYLIEVSDIENGTLSLAAPAKPTWATFTVIGNGKAKLSGTPPPSAAGTSVIRVVVVDQEIVVEQQYSLRVNTRPTVSNFNVTLDEDTSHPFTQEEFVKAFADADQQSLAAIQMVQKPGFGKLFLADVEVKQNDTIPATSLSSLVYKPNLNYAGTDAFFWKASDGDHFSAAPASVTITIRPVNDAPIITLESDSLHYEVNGESAFLTPLFEIEDPDDDSLTHAEIGFRIQHFRPDEDILLFQNTSNVKGSFDFESGKLLLTGRAPITEYKQAIRALLYNYTNTLDPILELKSVYFKANDGKLWSEEKDRIITLQYTFIELEIPSGFTPNGDNANDKWIITRPGGIEKLTEAIIRVYTKRGVLVFETEGFDQPWDGTMNGDALPADTYFFTIDLKLRSKKTYKGIVTILR